MKKRGRTYQKISVICPNCLKSNVVKRGRRKTRYTNKQLYFCKGCQKRFTDQVSKYMMYSPQVIYHALNIYHLGYNLMQTSKLVNKKFKVKTSKSTIYYWTSKFKEFCPISSIRNGYSKDDDILFTKRFEHENLDYLFMYHKYKLKVLACKDFKGLEKYIKSFEHGCPDVFFEVGKRCSEPIFKVG